MRILVTGGFGFLGGRLIQYLLRNKEYHVFAGTRKKIEPDSLPPFFRGVNVVTTVWSSAEQLESVCNDVDLIIHLAAMDAHESLKDPVGALEMNAVSTVRLLEAAVKNKVKRFIYLSTANIYGSHMTGEIDEDHIAKPTHPYATSHKAAEDVVWAANRLEKIEGIILRLSNSFGTPAQKEANCWNLLIPELCKQAVLNNALVLRSHGLQKRDFIPISDACRAIGHFINLPKELLHDGIFNVGGEYSPSVWEIACKVQKRFKDLFHKDVEIIRPPIGPNDRDEPLRYKIDLLRKTGFELTSSIDNEIDELLRFCKANFYGRIEG